MNRPDKSGRARRPAWWPVRPRWTRRTNSGAQYDYFSSPWLLNFLLFVLGPVMALRALGLYYTDPEPRWYSAYPYSYVYEAPSFDFHLIFDNVRQWTAPWPVYEKGRLGWYRQGVQEVRDYRALIEQLTQGDDIAIMLAAAVANQGNSPQRPFGWEGAERLQVWIGQNLSWPLPQWEWAYGQWVAWFEQYSVGIGQITPGEVEELGYEISEVDLFNDAVSIEIMLEKLVSFRHQAERLNLSPTDTFILTLIGNNNAELDTVAAFNRTGRDLAKFLELYPSERIQLLRMVTYVNHLHVYEQWPMPRDIDWEYVWELARGPEQ